MNKESIALFVRRRAIASCLEAWRSKRKIESKVKRDLGSAYGDQDEVWRVTGRVVWERRAGVTANRAT